MFAHLQRFKWILVTGPQRSGTRIAAKMIAHDTGHRFLDEYHVYTDSLYRLARYTGEAGNIVIHGPALCRWCHAFGRDSDYAVVLMHRPIADIIASERRVEWGWEPIEKVLYNAVGSPRPIAEIKYEVFERHQRAAIRNVFDVDYASLAAHPLFVPKAARAGFRADQTAPG